MLCSLYDLVNRYEQCHASISSQQPCSGLAKREEKKKQGGIKILGYTKIGGVGGKLKPTISKL